MRKSTIRIKKSPARSKGSPPKGSQNSGLAAIKAPLLALPSGSPPPPPPPPKSLPDLIEILSKYHTPVPPDAPVGSLVLNLTALAADINTHWPNLKPKYKTINGAWTVFYLASDIDLRNGN